MKLVEVIARAGSADTVEAIATTNEAHDFRVGLRDERGRQSMRLLVSDDKVQAVLDALRSVLGAQPEARILVMPLEVSLPQPPERERSQEESATAAREALYAAVEREVRLDQNFVVLVVLSIVVAAIGLVENNVAVVIGAMVIAPLLGPNIALGPHLVGSRRSSAFTPGAARPRGAPTQQRGLRARLRCTRQAARWEMVRRRAAPGLATRSRSPGRPAAPSRTTW